MKHCINFIVALTLLAFLLPVQSVRADMAPPPAPGLGGLRPLQYQSTEVQMVYERVELTLEPIISPKSEDNGASSVQEKVNVTAWFVLHNTGTKDEEMKAVFPITNLNNTCNDSHQNIPGAFGLQELFVDDTSFRVTNNGTEIPIEITDIEGIECVNWVAFDVYFPVDQDVLIRIDYSMQTWGFPVHDLMLNYILETGAGWKGPIKQAYIIFKLPYLVTPENIDTSQTTQGYQFLYNEVYWSYQNLEPTPDDNIIVAFFEPRSWANILELRNRITKKPTDVDAWLNFLEKYKYTYSYDSITMKGYLESAIKANPDNAELYARYAYFLNSECCSFEERGDTKPPTGAREKLYEQVVPLLNRSLALNPQNKSAKELMETIHWVFPDITFTPPPTIPPTATSAVSSTPTETPSPSITPRSSQTPVIEKVIVTKIVTATPEKPTVTATATVSPSSTLTPSPEAGRVQTTKSGSNWILWPILLFAGFVGGVFISKKKWI